MKNKTNLFNRLKKLPEGSRIIFEKAELVVRTRKAEELFDSSDRLYLGAVKKIETRILDDVEKRYLRGIIRPFRDKVEFIMKSPGFRKNEEFVTIQLKTDERIDLPIFTKGSMYKNMIVNEDYTLEILGLE